MRGKFPSLPSCGAVLQLANGARPFLFVISRDERVQSWPVFNFCFEQGTIGLGKVEKRASFLGLYAQLTEHRRGEHW